jgi:hypothetical protein
MASTPIRLGILASIQNPSVRRSMCKHCLRPNANTARYDRRVASDMDRRRFASRSKRPSLCERVTKSPPPDRMPIGVGHCNRHRGCRLACARGTLATFGRRVAGRYGGPTGWPDASNTKSREQEWQYWAMPICAATRSSWQGGFAAHQAGPVAVCRGSVHLGLNVLAPVYRRPKWARETLVGSVIRIAQQA